jgi:DNA-binding protein H-NS
MATLEKVQARIARLRAQAEALAAKRSSGVIAKIRELMEKHGLSIADIDAHAGGKKRGPKAGAKGATKAASAAAKYRDPKTGATWSGRGRAPAWIANAKDRTRFLIDATGAAAGNSKAGVKAPGKVGAMGKLPPKYLNPKTGETWSGHARPPAWIKDVKDRSKFLIAGGANTDVATSADAVSKAKTAVKKASKAVGATLGKGQPKGPQPALYHDPKSGATWSGRGRAPAWLAGAKDRTSFLIDGTAAIATDATIRTASKPKPAGRSSAAAKKATAK